MNEVSTRSRGVNWRTVVRYSKLSISTGPAGAQHTRMRSCPLYRFTARRVGCPSVRLCHDHMSCPRAWRRLRISSGNVVGSWSMIIPILDGGRNILAPTVAGVSLGVSLLRPTRAYRMSHLLQSTSQCPYTQHRTHLVRLVDAMLSAVIFDPGEGVNDEFFSSSAVCTTTSHEPKVTNRPPSSMIPHKRLVFGPGSQVVTKTEEV